MRGGAGAARGLLTRAQNRLAPAPDAVDTLVASLPPLPSLQATPKKPATKKVVAKKPAAAKATKPAAKASGRRRRGPRLAQPPPVL